MKGITPVIAIILLLLITISMVGFAFVWFTRVSELATKQTEEQLQAQLSQQAQKIRIDSSTTTTVTVRNTGSQTIGIAKITVFIAGVLQTCAWLPNADLAAGSVATCTWAGACTTGQVIKVTAPGNEDSVNCPA